MHVFRGDITFAIYMYEAMTNNKITKMEHTLAMDQLVGNINKNIA